jgi:hypothetical protein
MESIDFELVKQRARLKYELARVRNALLGFAPAWIVVVLAACMASRPHSAMVFGCAMFGAGVALLWYGRDLKRAVLPGVAAGLVPLVFALLANHFGHACTGSGCMSLCVPACTAGGLVAGLSVAIVGYRGGHGLGYWAGASAVALLTGAMGCACVGYSGLLGLAVGYGAGCVPVLARKLSR